MEFRQIEREDLPLLRDWRNQILKSTREYRLLNMLNQEKWFEKISLERNNDMFLIMDKEPIGVCGLTYINWKDRHAEISYYLERGEIKEVYDFLKKKAFEEYGLNRLWKEIYIHNKERIEIALKNGLIKEGTLRETNWWEGKFHDSIIVSILAKEYFGTRKL